MQMQRNVQCKLDFHFLQVTTFICSKRVAGPNLGAYETTHLGSQGPVFAMDILWDDLDAVLNKSARFKKQLQ